MALKKNITIQFLGTNVVVPDAYMKIARIDGSKERLRVTVEVKDKKDGQSLSTHTHQFEPSLDGDNFIRQGYVFIKTLPEYADAVDC